MTARRHKAQVLMGTEIIIVVDKHGRGVELQVVFDKADVIGKYKESGIAKAFFHGSNSSQIVFQRQVDPICSRNGAVSPAHMQRNRVSAAANLFQYLQVLSLCRIFKG